MSVLVPLDDNGHPIQILGFDYRGRLTIPILYGKSNRNETPIPTDIQIVTLWSPHPCFFEIGDENITADLAKSPFLAPNYYLDVPLRKGEQHVAVISSMSSISEGSSTHCSLYVMGRI